MFELPRKLQRRHEINDLVEWHGLTNVERMLEVHRTTIQRWCNGVIDVPVVAIIALRSLKGDFPHMEARKKWEGWRFGRDGTLYCPAGQAFQESEIRSIPLANQLISALKERMRDLEAKLDKGNIEHRVVITANDTYEDPANPVLQMKDQIYQLTKSKRGRKPR